MMKGKMFILLLIYLGQHFLVRIDLLTAVSQNTMKLISAFVTNTGTR